MNTAAFYCVSDSRYFLGAVAMINSLRLQGHEQPIYLLDLGLTPEQRELLAPQVSFVEAPADVAPWLAKTVAPLRHPADVMVLIDADMIVTRPLDELIASAAEGKVVAFENSMDRFVAEWGELLELGPLERRPYVSSGLVVLAGQGGRRVLADLDDRQRRVDIGQSFYGTAHPDYPFLYPEQDVLNALLAARGAPPLAALDRRLAPVPPYEGVKVLDAGSLRVAGAAGEPYVIHQFLSPKPWLGPTHDGVYSQLLRRLLGGADVAISVARDEIPLRLRPGPLAYAERRRIDLGEQLRWRLEGRRRKGSR